MKAIMISDHAKWCALMMNGKKTIEVRKENVGKAVQKLIDEQGYADIYVYCAKDKHHRLIFTGMRGFYPPALANGKVPFKFRCYKVEKITTQMWTPIIEHEILKKSCLKECELFDYICSHDGTEDKLFYTIHISDLEIFDKPKELSEFRKLGKKCEYQGRDTFCDYCSHCDCIGDELTKAPQSFCYVEVER